MKVTDILDVSSVKVGVATDSKPELLNSLLELAATTGKILNKESARKEIFDREKIMSTGIGKGIALPHAKTSAVSESVGSLAVLSKPIDFESIDGDPVSIVFLLLGRESAVGNHLRILSKISRFLNNDEFRAAVLGANSPEEVVKLFNSMEEAE
ncbi:MAG: PTS sugar transporter subunit IIA [Chloroflexota bacterium]